jgi:hypothetical protein
MPWQWPQREKLRFSTCIACISGKTGRLARTPSKHAQARTR